MGARGRLLPGARTRHLHLVRLFIILIFLIMSIITFHI
jgi:hypothetical protein